MIRAYTPKDAGAAVEIWAAASALAHPFLSPAFQKKERRLMRDVFLPQSETWVWEAEGTVAGFISLSGNEVGAIFIDPEHQRTGIGRALMDHARDRHGDLEVEVFRRNHGGRAFYEHLGFKEIGRYFHPETGFEMIRLRLEAGAGQ